MNKEYHILNGDCLKDQFPSSLNGEIIVARLCLVDGDVKANDLETLFDIRAKFISKSYPGYLEKDYYDRTVPEIRKIQNITDKSEINLWFEEDLFCQVNFWFVMNLIYENGKNNSVFLVLPKEESKHGFGDMSTEELIFAFNNKIEISNSEISKLAKLWRLYQDNRCDDMLKIANKLEAKFFFLTPAIIAHKDRFPLDKGRVFQSLVRIMKEIETDEFTPVFQEFCRQESIYGFGDLQVKRIYDEIMKNK